MIFNGYCVIVISKKCTKKRGLITSSTSFRYRQTPNNLKRVKAHAILPISNDKNKKQTLLPYVFMSLFTHRHYDLLLIILTITDCKDKK